ncbi:MAG: DUF1269 domain-containing protein [Gemmataceae bacterium]|nr:DUF1269 domain-containing protein [Gemmataceae bacterium]
MHGVGDLNLWALGYDDPDRAREVRAQILGFEDLHGLHVNDAVVVARLADGSFTLARDEQPTAATGVAGFGFLGLVIGAVVLQPLAGAVVGAALGGLGVGLAKRLGIDDAFVREVRGLMRPGTSALFLLTRTDNPEAVVRHITGLGGAVVKTNVHADLARQVQEALDTPRPTP